MTYLARIVFASVAKHLKLRPLRQLAASVHLACEKCTSEEALLETLEDEGSLLLLDQSIEIPEHLIANFKQDEHQIGYISEKSCPKKNLCPYFKEGEAFYFQSSGQLLESPIIRHCLALLSSQKNYRLNSFFQWGSSHVMWTDLEKINNWPAELMQKLNQEEDFAKEIGIHIENFLKLDSAQAHSSQLEIACDGVHLGLMFYCSSEGFHMELAQNLLTQLNAQYVICEYSSNKQVNIAILFAMDEISERSKEICIIRKQSE